MTTTFHLDPNAINASLLDQAGACLRGGGLVAFPTETVYGLGANALDENAVARIFAAKGRPSTDPLILHLADYSALETIAQSIPPLAETLATRFWPGPLTLILPRRPEIPANLSAGLPTVAVRIPAHPIALGLIRSAGVPIAAPSANTFSRPSPTRADHVLQDLVGKIDLLLDGGQTTIGLESTILDLTAECPTILRPGGISLETLREIVPDVQVHQRYLGESQAATAPGMMLKHYSPRAKIYLFTGPADAMQTAMRQKARDLQAQGQEVGLLAMNENPDDFSGVRVFHLGNTLPQIAENLFAGLRWLDSQGVEAILARDYGRSEVGLAIWDRLVRAAEGQVIEV